jgi:hypothetical protein
MRMRLSIASQFAGNRNGLENTALRQLVFDLDPVLRVRPVGSQNYHLPTIL